MSVSYRIGELAARFDMTVEGLRFYERRGLLMPSSRGPSGYRRYSEGDARTLRFIKAAQEMGFTLAEVEELLQLRSGRSDTCESMHERLVEKQDRVRQKIALLRTLDEGLARGIERCRERIGSGATKDCPVLDDLWATDQADD